MTSLQSESDVSSCATVPVDRGRRALPGFDLVIFDCDGVLVDSEMLSCACLADLLSGHGLKTSLGDVFDLYLGLSSATVAQEFLRATGRPLPESFGDEYRTRLARSLAGSLRATPAIDTVLQALATPFCLASSSGRDRVQLSLDITGLAPFFAGRIYDASMVAWGKPAPDLFLHAARQLGAAPSRTLVIEDSPNGVRAAKAAGMTAWGFLGGSHHAHFDGATLLRAAGADRLFQNMTAFFAPEIRAE